MIVITTPTGQIGRQVLGNVLKSPKPIRVIARDPSLFSSQVRECVDIVQGSHGDRRPIQYSIHSVEWEARAVRREVEPS